MLLKCRLLKCVLSLNLGFSSMLTPGGAAIETEMSCVVVCCDADSSVNITYRSGASQVHLRQTSRHLVARIGKRVVSFSW